MHQSGALGRMYCTISFSNQMRTIVLMLLIQLSLNSLGQPGYQIADTTKKWNTLYAGIGAWDILCCEKTKTNVFNGDTIIGNLNYLKVLESIDSNQSYWEFKGFLREDSVSRCTYFRSGNNEGLLYNFNLDINDTVVIHNYYQFGYTAEIICTSIDSVIINGESKKRYLFKDASNGYPDIDTWIEGIGSIYGILCSGIWASGMTGGYRNLLCCSQSDSIIYIDSVYNSCYIDDFYPNILQDNFDTGYLGNMYEYQLNLTDTTGIGSFEWIYGYGPPFLQFDNGRLYGLPNSAGSFPCFIMIKNNEIDLITDYIESNVVILNPTIIREEHLTGGIFESSNSIKLLLRMPVLLQ